MEQNKNMDYFHAVEILAEIERNKNILSSGIFSLETHLHQLRQSAFTEFIINLRDLLFKSEEYGNRISFSDDIDRTEYIRDITDLVTFFRNAVCHVNSMKNYVENSYICRFYMIVGAESIPVMKDGVSIRCDYEDEICFVYGTQKIYLHRHLVRVFNETHDFLLPIIAQWRNDAVKMHLESITWLSESTRQKLFKGI